jgi:hypothetical protein
MKASEFITELRKGQKDANGYTRCWPGKHAEGTKRGKNGGQVRNCVPNESEELNEYIVRSGDDIMSVMSLNLFADLLGQGNLSEYDEEFANSPKWQAVVAEWAPKAEFLQREISKYQSTGRKLRDAEADAIDATAYDGGDAYENADTAAKYLPKVYNKQASAIVRLLKDGYANPPTGMHEGSRSVDIATQDELDHQDAMAARAFDRNQNRIARQQGNLAAGVDVGRWLKPYQMLVKNNFEPVETKDRFEYLMQIALKLKGTNAGFSGDTGMSHAARIFGLQHQEQKLVANLIRNCPKIRDLENYTNSEITESAADEKNWMAQIKSKYPNVRWLQAKMPGAPLLAYVDGKEVARFNYNKELAEEFDLIESIIEDIAERNGVDSEVIWEDLESLDDDELYVFATTSTIMETEAWQKANKKDRTDGMSRKAVKAYRREHPGSKLKTAVTTKPSKLKKGSKASKRRKSYCSRSKGQMKMHNISCAKTPDKAICKARRRWNC